jgi:hypothetical protein
MSKKSDEFDVRQAERDAFPEYNEEEKRTVPQITAGQLIGLLQSVDSLLPVMLEGCDCSGEAVGITVSNGKVYIRRNEQGAE